ncbi:MAG: hypothetical protein HFJ52_02490 [Clostridia bacterium]|nr:hypothetical protein [Clostridia bacterium]
MTKYKCGLFMLILAVIFFVFHLNGVITTIIACHGLSLFATGIDDVLSKPDDKPNDKADK